jgi:pyrimidine-nucleoside phosphorylase
MRAVDVISKKRDGGELTKEEIDFFIRGFNADTIPDYQAAAWAMAVLLKGMTPRETADLTLAIVRSGDTLDLSKVVPVAVDKHSTGGVGDKTTLVVGPVVAACGLPVGKMSGRGLGFSGGTLDKLESFPGFKTNLTTDAFLTQLGQIGLVVTGQSVDLAPADGKLYALRDVTGTVPSIPLIASSVMSKKIAAGAQGIVLDVKVGLGAFMQNLQEARELATMMVSIAQLAGRKAVALLADMNQPLGFAVGNALEVKEAIATLNGEGPPDFEEHSLVLAAHMLVLGGITKDVQQAHEIAERVLKAGEALEKFVALIKAQGGDESYILKPERLPAARYVESVAAEEGGYISRIHARLVGEATVELGAGRAKKGDSIDPAVGVKIPHKVGNKVEPGQTLFTVYANDQNKLEAAKEALQKAFTLQEERVEQLPLIYDIIKKID